MSAVMNWILQDIRSDVLMALDPRVMTKKEATALILLSGTVQAGVVEAQRQCWLSVMWLKRTCLTWCLTLCLVSYSSGVALARGSCAVATSLAVWAVVPCWCPTAQQRATPSIQGRYNSSSQSGQRSACLCGGELCFDFNSNGNRWAARRCVWCSLTAVAFLHA